MAQFDGKPIIPLDDVCRHFFPHLSVEKLSRKATSGEILIPIVRVEDSQKAAKGVHIQDLADYLDRRRDKAIKEFKQINGLK